MGRGALIPNPPSIPDVVDIVVVGAGAAGLATAIFTRRLNPTLSVVLLDGAKKPGAKILISGGTRCNVTNTVVTERDFWGGRSTIVRRILRGFPVSHTTTFFREIGIPLHEETDGKLFPDSNRARDVLSALLNETDRVGVRLYSDYRVLDVTREHARFRVHTARGDLAAAAVVLATGGRSLPKTGSDGLGLAIAERLGHTVVETTPGLAPLVLSDDSSLQSLHKQLSGVTHDAELTIWADGKVTKRLTGSLLWTHFGLSGPVALNASRHWMRAHIEHTCVTLTANFCPGRSFEEVDASFTRTGTERPKASVQSAVGAGIPASVASALIQRLEIDAALPLSQLRRDGRRRLARALVEWTLPVVDTRGYNYAEVTAGGIALTEIDPASMESRACPKLYLVGEMLDVDGRIGGFNFQWAWATARVAAGGLTSFHAEDQHVK